MKSNIVFYMTFVYNMCSYDYMTFSRFSSLCIIYMAHIIYHISVRIRVASQEEHQIKSASIHQYIIDHYGVVIAGSNVGGGWTWYPMSAAVLQNH